MARVFILIILMAFVIEVWGQMLNGFDLKDIAIPVKQIFRGGPPRDGIPSIDHPVFYPASAGTIKNDIRILGVYYNGVAKAYPINILNYHEIVNDDFGGEKIVLTYCPLCGSGIAFVSTINGEDNTFGVSGLLYNSDVLLYDRNSESLWSQMLSVAISGPLKGTKLTLLSTENTTWEEWESRYPKSLYLSDETGYTRDYTHTPYLGYDDSEQLYFPVSNTSSSMHQKERVLGIEVNGKFKAYPYMELQKLDGPQEDIFNKQVLILSWHDQSKSATVTNEKGNNYPSITAFWFAWYAFHPKTKIFTAKK